MQDSVTCLHCKGMYRRDTLHIHLKKWKSYVSPLKSPEKTKVQAIKHHSMPVIPRQQLVSQQVLKGVLCYMQNDEIGKVAKSDPLILQLGNQFHKSWRDTTDKGYVSRAMRDMARLLIEVKKLDEKIKCLSDTFNVLKFGKMVDAVEKLNGYDEETGHVRVVGLAYRLLQPLMQCLRIHYMNMAKEIEQTNSKDFSPLERLKIFIKVVEFSGVPK